MREITWEQVSTSNAHVSAAEQAVALCAAKRATAQYLYKFGPLQESVDPGIVIEQ